MIRNINDRFELRSATLSAEDILRKVADGIKVSAADAEKERKSKIDRINAEFADVLVRFYEMPDPTGTVPAGESVIRHLPNATATELARAILMQKPEWRPHFEERGPNGLPLKKANGERLDGLRTDDHGNFLSSSVVWRIEKILRLLVEKTPSITPPAWLKVMVRPNHAATSPRVEEVPVIPPALTVAEIDTGEKLGDMADIKPAKASKSAVNRKLKAAAAKKEASK